MAEPTVMGLPIEGFPEDFTPLSALVVVKGLDGDGDVQYLARATDGLMSVEALGMAHYAILALTEQFHE